MKKFFKGLFGHCLTVLVYTFLIGTLFLSSGAESDPRIHSVAKVGLIAYTILYTLIAFLMFLAGMGSHLSMSKYDNCFVKNERKTREEEAEILSSRDSMADSFTPRGVFHFMTRLYTVLLFIGLCVVAAMAGYVWTTVWILWSAIWLWIGDSVYYSCHKRAFESKKGEIAAAVSKLGNAIPVNVTIVK